MALSANSVLALSDALCYDFVRYVRETSDQELSELLAEAASDFIAESIGDVDDELYYEVASQLVSSTDITIV